jgi:hypothetical protein
MKNILAQYRTTISGHHITLFSLILYIIFQVSIMAMTLDLGADLLGLQITLSSERFLEIARSWREQGLMTSYYRHFYLDFIHPVVYGVFLSSFMAQSFAKRKISRRYDMLLLVPYLAALCDLAENCLHLYLLADLERVTPLFVAVSGTVTSIKWIAALMSLFGSAALYFGPQKKQARQ